MHPFSASTFSGKNTYYLNKKKVWVEMYGSGFQDYGMTGAAGVFATGSVLPVIPGTGFFTPVRVFT